MLRLGWCFLVSFALISSPAMAEDSCQDEAGEEGLFLKEVGTVEVLPSDSLERASRELPSAETPEQPEAFNLDDVLSHHADFVVSRTMAERYVRTEWRFFSSSSCAIKEGCVAAPGWRRLLRFHTRIINQGTQSFHLGDPGDPDNRDNVQYDSCHGHYHVKDWAEYSLINSRGGVEGRGRKQAFCLRDDVRISGNLRGKYDCDYQGITRGWADSYASTLPCQWIDITGVDPGEYELKLQVNPERRYRELRYLNNTVRIPVRIRASTRDQD